MCLFLICFVFSIFQFSASFLTFIFPTNRPHICIEFLLPRSLYFHISKSCCFFIGFHISPKLATYCPQPHSNMLLKIRLSVFCPLFRNVDPEVWDSELKSDYCGESTQRLGPIFPLTHSTKMTGFNPPLLALPLIPLLSQLLVRLLPMILVHDHLMILLGGPGWLACYQGGLTTTSGQLKFIKVWLLGLTVANCHFENSFGSFFMLSLLRVWLVQIASGPFCESPICLYRSKDQ